MRLLYFDTSTYHNTIWKDINNNFEPLNQEIVKKIFCVRPGKSIINNYLEDKALFIIHTGEDFFSSNLNKNNFIHGWKNIYEALNEANKQKIKIVFVSGGSLRISKDEVLENDAFKLFYFYPRPIKKEEQTKNDLKRMIKVWEESGDIIFFEEKTEQDVLIAAIIILIQGYLAVQAPECVFGGDSNSRDEANKFIEENNLFSESKKRADAEARTSFDSLVRPSDKITDSKLYWFDVLNEEVGKLTSETFNAEYQLKSESKLLHLWKIFRGHWLGLEEKVNEIPTNQDEWTILLLSVHNECKEILNNGKKKSLIEEYEKRRSSLNHDLVKNKFLLKLGELSEGLNTKERSAFLYDYFKYLSGRNNDDTVVKARYETVKEALKNWTEVKSRLESFLLKEIDEFEIEPTDDYKMILNEIALNPDSILKIIDTFISKMKSLPNFDLHTINVMLDEFWNNAELLHQKLSMLQMNSLPNKYFKPK